MKILIVGFGWTGKKMYAELIHRGHDVEHASHTEVFDALDRTYYDWVVNCAGFTGTPNVDACEQEPIKTIEANTLFPIQLHYALAVFGTRLAHFSSGCIYEGDINSVDAKPNFFGSIYSLSKGISDSCLKELAQVYRIRMPFTSVDEPKNYLNKILKYAKTGKLIEGGANSLTDLDEAVRVACDLIEENAPNGPYNLVNNGSVNMHRLVELLDIQPQWYTQEEFAKVTVAKRSNCIIPAYEKMSSLEDALRNAIKGLKNI